MSIVRKLISCAQAPQPVAAYNQAVQVERTLYVSGVLGLDKDTNKLVEGGVAAETRQALQSLGYILQEAESSFEKVVKCTLLLNDIQDFQSVNDIYTEFFKSDYPARCAYQVAALPLGAKIEIEAIALTGDVKTEGGLTGCNKCGPANCTCKL